MKVLHIEDYDPSKGKDYAKALAKLLKEQGIFYLNVQYLRELLKLNPNEYDAIILDGQFPLAADREPDVESFHKALEFLMENRVSIERLIVWSNSTRVHKYCVEKGIRYFSKKTMKIEDYEKKNIDPIAIAQKADENSIARELTIKG